MVQQQGGNDHDQTIYRLHDQLSHFLLQHKELAILFFKNVLNPTMVQAIDWQTFTRLHDKHTSDNLTGSVSDIVYTVQYKGTMLLHLILVLEHKSYLPQAKFPIQYQLMSYMGQHVARFMQNNPPPEEAKEAPSKVFATPLIKAVVLYNGEKPWRVPTLREHFSKVINDEDVLDEVMHIPYTLFDLSRKTDEELIEFYGDAIGFCTGFLALKHAWDEKMLPIVTKMIDLFQQTPAAELNKKELSIRKAVFTFILRAIRQPDEVNPDYVLEHRYEA